MVDAMQSTTVNNTEADLNPFRAPRVASAPDSVSMPWSVAIAAVLLLLTIVIGLGVEAYEHETIIGSGPVLFLVGLALSIVAFRSGDILFSVIGVSAMLLCALVVFLINFFGWGPPQGDAPITMISWIYSAVVVPVIVWRIVVRPSSPNSDSGDST